VKDVLELAVSIAREAGALQRDRFGEPRTIETKSSAIDLVTDVDHACDELIIRRISDARPGDGVLTEESGEARPSETGLRWVIDPLDGTTNYAHAFPHFAVSIGVERDGRREIGVVYDPMRDELFSAQRSAGAWLNGRPIHVSESDVLEKSLLATGFAYDVHQGKTGNLEYFSQFLVRARAIRRAGSAALDLAYVACGRFDGFWEMHLSQWDVSAGYTLIEAAGGKLSDFDGSAVPESGARCVASNGRLHPALLDVIGSC